MLTLIRSTRTHPGARWVYDQLKAELPGISMATVYRNIGVLLEEGDLASLGIINGEARFDGNTGPHPHFVCIRCGLVADLPGDPEPLAGPSGHDFTIDYRRTVYYGLCGPCTRETPAYAGSNINFRSVL